MVDVQTVSIAVASAGVLVATAYYVLCPRQKRGVRQTDLIMKLYSEAGAESSWKPTTILSF